ncbi:MAG: hypothetical protein L6R40_004330 [Gallowayella cf. fulva]|nr:MAG: hypothetical protein L6R40_004330 [Xanthomendoza cf. fulva]
MFATKLLRAAAAENAHSKVQVDRYKARKPWPPDFSKLDHKYQFRLERRFRRRTQLKWCPPQWVRRVNLFNYTLCSFVAVYAIFFMDTGPEETPMKKLRAWFKVQSSSLWTIRSEQPTGPAYDPTKTDTSSS